MEKFISCATIVLTLATGMSLVGCAAAAATAGYSLKAQTAECLSADAEQRIIDRAKREILAEVHHSTSPAPASQS